MPTCVLDRELKLDPPKERRRGMKNERVAIFLEFSAGKIGDPTVVVRLLCRDEFPGPVELDANASGRLSVLGVENVRRDGRRAGHDSDRHSSRSPLDLWNVTGCWLWSKRGSPNLLILILVELWAMRDVTMPTRADIDAAGKTVRRYLAPTPLVESAAVGGAELKLESMQPTGSFKVRGALTSLSRLPPGREVVTSSAGNHGLGVAYAAQLLGREATIVVPESASKAKVRALGRFRARLTPYGSTYDEAEQHALSLAGEDREYISPYNDRWVIAGQGTIGLELLGDARGPTTIVCPIGGGGLCSGVALCASGFRDVHVIGVDCESSPAMRASLDAGQIVEVSVRSSLADGLSGNLEPGSITYDLVGRHVAEVVVVTEEEIEDAMRHLALQDGLVVEGAGAAATAAVLSGRVQIQEKAVVLVTGRNIEQATLARVLASSG